MCVFCLQFIPMPVLYGVFLYMGASSLRGIQVSVTSACRTLPLIPCVGNTVGVSVDPSELTASFHPLLFLFSCLSLFLAPLPPPSLSLLLSLFSLSFSSFNFSSPSFLSFSLSTLFHHFLPPCNLTVHICVK